MRNAIQYLRFIPMVILTLLFIIPTYAQNTDVIKKIDSLNFKSKRYSRSNFDSTNYYTNKAISLSRKNNYLKGEVEALSYLAEAHRYLNVADSAIVLSQLVIDIALKEKDLGLYVFFAYYRICGIYHDKGQYTKAIRVAGNAIKSIDQNIGGKYIASMYNLKGLIYKRSGDFDKAQEQFIEALNYVSDDNYYLQSITFTNLGIINRNLEQYDQALKFYDLAIESSNAINDSIGLREIYQNIATVYSDLEKNKKSLSYNLKAIEITPKQNLQTITYATLLNNIGLNYDALQHTDSSIYFLNKALQLSFDIEDAYGIADTKINLARVYLKRSNSSIANKLVNEGIEIAQSIEADDLAIEGYEVLIDCDLAAKNYKTAFTNQQLLIALRDSVYNLEKVNAINELQEKYESEKKEQKIVLLETENELKDSEVKQQRMQRNGLIAFTLLVVCVAFIILYYYRKTKKAKNKIEVLQREIHHRVKNNLAIIRRLADVSRQNLQDGPAHIAIGELISRIESMTQVHAQLYRKTDITEVDLKNYLEELGQNITASFSTESVQFTQDIAPDISVGFSKAVPLGLIVNELLTNAFKYAKNASNLKITLSAKIQTDALLVLVSDNGQGLPKDFDLKKVNSYGLKLVSGLAQQLGGSINFYTNDGTTVEVRIPV